MPKCFVTFINNMVTRKTSDYLASHQLFARGFQNTHSNDIEIYRQLEAKQMFSTSQETAIAGNLIQSAQIWLDGSFYTPFYAPCNINS